MAKKGTEDVMREEFKKLAAQYKDAYRRLYDSYSASARVFCWKCKTMLHGRGNIPSQGSDIVLFRNKDSVGIQIEFKSVEGDKFNLTRLREDQIQAVIEAVDKNLIYWIIIDYVLSDTEVVHVPVSANFWIEYDKTKQTRFRHTMVLSVEDVKRLNLPYFTGDGAIARLYEHVRSVSPVSVDRTLDLSVSP